VVANFAIEHPDIFKHWQKTSNTLVVLGAKNLDELVSIIKKIETENIKHTIFREPDILNEITAVCVEPSEKTKKILSRFSLAGRGNETNDTANNYLNFRFDLTKQMNETEQFVGCNMLEHGQSVLEQYQLLLKNETASFYKIEKFKDIFDQHEQLDPFLVERYFVLHDCGKPFVKTNIDNTIRYPNHEAVSASIVKILYPTSTTLHTLVGNDMLFHNKTLDEQQKFLKENGKNLTLFLFISAYCAIHANKNMFGEESFKIKINNLLAKFKRLFGKQNKNLFTDTACDRL
jgi:hypothetical protein